ncbi:MAG: hypothetical protein Q3988_03555, partial [Gemella sp.]|nr:hypothetical protein [Gemella sp.]
KPNTNVPGYEFTGKTTVDKDGNTVHVYRKVVKTSAKPEVKVTTKKTPAKPVKKAQVAGELPKTSATTPETNSAIPAGLAASLAAAGLLAARRRKEK